MKYFCSLSLCPNSCFYMNPCLLCESAPLSALALNTGPEILFRKHHYFLNCVLPFKNRVFKEHVMLFHITQRPWVFFYQLAGLQDTEDKSHSHFLFPSWLSLCGIVCGTGFNGHSLHFLLLNDIYNLNVTDWLFWNFSLN